MGGWLLGGEYSMLKLGQNLFEVVCVIKRQNITRLCCSSVCVSFEIPPSLSFPSSPGTAPPVCVCVCVCVCVGACGIDWNWVVFSKDGQTNLPILKLVCNSLVWSVVLPGKKEKHTWWRMFLSRAQVTCYGQHS